MDNRHVLMDGPAETWDTATPVGCGFLGGMIYGTVSSEKIVLNEETIWAGGPQKFDGEALAANIAHTKELLLQDRVVEADSYCSSLGSDMFMRVRSYEYAGNLLVFMHGDDEAQEYVRKLDMENGVATVSYEKEGRKLTREIFASHRDRLICARFRSDSAFSCKVSFERENIDSMECTDDMITAECHTATGDSRFRVGVKIVTDGRTRAFDDGLRIVSAGKVELYASVVTSFRNDDLVAASERVMKNAARGWENILGDHIAEFSAVMNRAEIRLGHDGSEDRLGHDGSADRLTVAERLENVRNGAVDPGLISTYYNFGRYLMVSSSAPDSLPANLQGVWSEGLEAPWNADYHTNINLQMNYWINDAGNLSENADALFRYMNDYLLESGKVTARELYHARGTVVHHLSDIYGFTAPADGVWGLWPMGAAWLSFHLWDHYLYTNDVEFLKNTAYEFIKNSALFFIDTMAEHDGFLVTAPSTSPENRYKVTDENGEHSVSLTVSPSMDIEMVGELLDFYIRTEDILQMDEAARAEAVAAREKMPPLQISAKTGRLQEWIEDHEEMEPGHRHISHAFGLHPGTVISRKTPELYEALRKSLEYRLSHGGGHTGWSRAWLINIFSRLRDGENVLKHIGLLFARSTNINLFDMHPPFQIDGNFGGAAGISEMVLQSQEGFLSLLPAVSEKLGSGSFSGLMARGGFEVSCDWKDSTVTAFSVRSRTGKAIKTKVELPDNMKGTAYAFAGSDGNAYLSDADGFIRLSTESDRISLMLQKG